MTAGRIILKLKELRKAWVTARPTKWLLGAGRMEFLGHQVRDDLITTSSNKPLSTTTSKQVRSFLGLLGYYRDHIPVFAEISASLTELLKKGKAEHIQWCQALPDISQTILGGINSSWAIN